MRGALAAQVSCIVKILCDLCDLGVDQTFEVFVASWLNALIKDVGG